jgi:hypothetical protein
LCGNHITAINLSSFYSYYCPRGEESAPAIGNTSTVQCTCHGGRFLTFMLSFTFQQRNLILLVQRWIYFHCFQALPLFLDNIFNTVVAVILSVTFVLAFGEVFNRSNAGFESYAGWFCLPFSYYDKVIRFVKQHARKL